MRIKNKTITSFEELKRQHEALENEMAHLQRERDMKVDKIDRDYKAKINSVMRAADLVKNEMERAQKYISPSPEKGTINFTLGENGTPKIKDDAVFYKVDNRVRKVWEVTIYYDYYKYDKDFPERFVYYVDATTGEIIGGNRFYGAKIQ